jgi:hypothetical protein
VSYRSFKNNILYFFLKSMHSGTHYCTNVSVNYFLLFYKCLLSSEFPKYLNLRDLKHTHIYILILTEKFAVDLGNIHYV